MAFSVGERPGTLNLRGRGEYVNTKVRTSERVLSDQAEPRDYDPLRSDIWNLHKSSYNRISDVSHAEYLTTTRDDYDRVIREKARLPADRSSGLHVIRTFQTTDQSLSRQLSKLDTGALPTHPADHNQHTFKSTYRASYGHDARQGQPREPRCQPQQTADKWMAFRRRKSWLFDTDRAPTQFTDDPLTCPPRPKHERACLEADPQPCATCGDMDELEVQVAAANEKLAHRRHPAEPNTRPSSQNDPATGPEGLTKLAQDLAAHPEAAQFSADAEVASRETRPEGGEGNIAAEPGETGPQPQTEADVQDAKAAESEVVGTPPRDTSGEPQHRGPFYSDLSVPQRDRQLHACPDTAAGQRGPGPLHPSLPVTQDREQAGPPDPGCATRGPHPDDADAGRGQYERIADPEYPSAFRLARPCAGRPIDTSALFPCPETRKCPPPCPPSPPPVCPRGPLPCSDTPTTAPCPRLSVHTGRYSTTYSAGYSDPDAGLRQLAAPRAARELYRGPPVPYLQPGTRRCSDGLTRAVLSDVDPAPGPTTPPACVETVGGGEGLSGVPTPGRP